MIMIREEVGNHPPFFNHHICTHSTEIPLIDWCNALIQHIVFWPCVVSIIIIPNIFWSDLRWLLVISLTVVWLSYIVIHSSEQQQPHHNTKHISCLWWITTIWMMKRTSGPMTGYSDVELWYLDSYSLSLLGLYLLSFMVWIMYSLWF